MRKDLIIGLIASLTLLGMPAFSQSHDISFEHLTSENGLPNSTVLDILQDKKGFFWFATRNGLIRYDGYNYTLFKTEVKNNQSISDNWITTLFEDSEGILYAGTLDQGLNVYNSKKENFIRFKASQGLNSLCSDKIKCIIEDGKGIIWIGTADNGFCSYNKKENKFTTFSLPPKSVNNCFDLVIDKDDNLWMTNSMLELLKFIPETKEFIVVNDSFLGKQKSDDIKSTLLLDKNGNI